MGVVRFKIRAVLLAMAVLVTASNGYAADNTQQYSEYCVQSGGVVEEMPAEIQLSDNHWAQGQTKMFCNFYPDGGFLTIGLETFASEVPSIAATFIKKMPEITGSSSWVKGPYPAWAQNICKNIGGAMISFVAAGGFSNPSGQTDICVFGDGSMVSGWSLVYMANHRAGYDEIKDKVKALPLNIPIPLGS